MISLLKKEIDMFKRHEGNGSNHNGRFVVDDTPERQSARAQIGRVVAQLRPLLQFAAASRVNRRFDLERPALKLEEDP